MKSPLLAFGLGFLALRFSAIAIPSKQEVGDPSAIAGTSTRAIVTALANARSTVLVQSYPFINSPIAKALVNAHKRGVKVQVIFQDNNFSQKISANYLSRAGIATFIDPEHTTTQQGMMVIDEQTMIAGAEKVQSSADANRNDGLRVVSDPKGAKDYLKSWNLHLKHSRLYRWKPGQDGSRTDGMDVALYMRHGSGTFSSVNTRFVGK